MSDRPRTVHVVGTGLIGTSVALAATAAGLSVSITDSDPERAKLAAALGAGVLGQPSSRADVAVVAVPPAAVPAVVVQTIRADLAECVTHVASVQSQPQLEIEMMIGEFAGFVGSHPIAGREVSGPQHADAELFRDRPWVVCPTRASSSEAVDSVLALVAACGGVPVVMDAAAHDEALARLSHVPQLVASALAATLRSVPAGEAALAGSGIRDTTRLADSDPSLWSEIVAANAQPIAAALRAVADPLSTLAGALEAGGDVAAAEVAALVTAGRAGRALLPGKHGRPAAALATAVVVIPDRPGALADLFGHVAANAVNLEDVRIEHAPGQPLGVVELTVAPADRDRLVDALRSDGWSATAGADAAL